MLGTLWGFPGGASGKKKKNLPANAGDIRDTGSTPESGRSPGGEHGNSLQYSCLENPTDREPWRVMIHRVAKSQTPLKRLRSSSSKGSYSKPLLLSNDEGN